MCLLITERSERAAPASAGTFTTRLRVNVSFIRSSGSIRARRSVSPAAPPPQLINHAGRRTAAALPFCLPKHRAGLVLITFRTRYPLLQGCQISSSSGSDKSNRPVLQGGDRPPLAWKTDGLWVKASWRVLRLKKVSSWGKRKQFIVFSLPSVGSRTRLAEDTLLKWSGFLPAQKDYDYLQFPSICWSSKKQRPCQSLLARLSEGAGRGRKRGNRSAKLWLCKGEKI